MRTAPWHLMICYCTFVTCVYLLLYCCCHDASHGTITLPPPYVTVAMRLLFIDAVLVSDVTGLKAVRKLLSHQSTESFPNGIINMLLDSVRPSFVFFLVCSGFLLGLLHGFSFLLFNDDLNWGLQLFHVVLGSLWAPGCRCALGVMLVPLAPGKVPTVPHFQHLCLMALTVVQQSPKALEMALNPVQTDSCDSVSWLCRWWHYVLLFDIFQPVHFLTRVL